MTNYPPRIGAPGWHDVVVPDLSRRAALRLSAGAAGAAVFGALAGSPTAGADQADQSDQSDRATMVTGSFISGARGGIPTNWAIARPPGETGVLRPLIALHGKGSSAASVMAGGVEQGLAEAAMAGLPPFAVVAVDGGGSYWHRRASGDDAGAMVIDELIPMLANQHDLDTSRVGFLGWSMGGYGALLLGARLGPARTAAICAVSPALWLSPEAAAPGAFDSAEDFAANTVFGLPALGSIPVRVDCGTDDPFHSATKEFVAQLPNPPAGGFSPGGHDAGYWSSQLPGEIAWLAPLLTA